MFNPLSLIPGNSPTEKKNMIDSLHRELSSTKQEYERVHNSPDLLFAVKNLKKYQRARLIETHKDHLAHPNTKEAATFFLNELYGEQDFSLYYKDLDKLLPTMEKTFPAPALAIIVKALSLNLMTEQLDNAMAEKLGSSFTDEEYWKVYKETGTFEQRMQQLHNLQDIGQKLISVSKIPLISQLLNVMNIPAKQMGLLNLHNFLKNGFHIFKNTKNAEVFLQSIYDREYQLLLQHKK